VPTITIIDEEKRSLFYHPGSEVVHHKMRNGVVGSDFRDLLSRGADWLEKNGARKWLSDDRDNTIVAPEDYEWGDTHWAPRVIRAGFKYWAIVVPASAVGSLQMRRFATEYRERGVTVSVFDNPEAALVWLESMN
jgi:hypothetical protein